MRAVTNGWRDRGVPELLLGLAVIAIAFVVTGFVVADAIRDVKQSRDTIRVTGSARHPITANLVIWHLGVDAKAERPEEATRLLRTRTAAVRDFLLEDGIPDSAITPSTVSTEETTIRDGRRRREFQSPPANWSTSPRGSTMRASRP
jgi:hypothetical protein